MTGSHTSVSADDTAVESGRLRLVSTADRGLPDLPSDSTTDSVPEIPTRADRNLRRSCARAAIHRNRAEIREIFLRVMFW